MHKGESQVKESQVKCMACNATFSSEGGARIHYGKVHKGELEVEESKVKCTACSATFSSEKGARIHYGKVHKGETQVEETQVKCTACSETFSSEKGARIHYGKVHKGESQVEESQVKCTACSETFGSEKGAKIHYGKLHKGEPQVEEFQVKCTACSAIFGSEKGARIHYGKVHKDVDKEQCQPLGTNDKRNEKSKPQTNHLKSLDEDVQRDRLPVTDAARERLKKHQGRVRLTHDDISRAADSVNYLVDVFLEKLNELSSLRWYAFSSGSYYDKTKNISPDEFDIMFYPDVQVSVDFSNLSTPGFYKVKIVSTRVEELDITVDKAGYILPGKFKNYAFELFEEAIGKTRQSRRIKKKDTSKNSPSYAILYNNGVNEIDIDLVPCFNINGWPSIAKRINPDWLSLDKVVNDAMESYDVVCKTFPEDTQDRNLLWRLSFTRAEKMLLNHANSADPSNFKKSALRVIKSCIQETKDNNHCKIKKFCSYYIKHFMFSEYDSWPQKEVDDVVIIRNIFKRMIGTLTLPTPTIANYFLPNDNIIRYIPKQEIGMIVSGLQVWVKQY